MLRMTITEPELIADPDIYIFFEKGTRGATSYISSRYRKSNNKHLKSYDLKQESKQEYYVLRHE